MITGITRVVALSLHQVLLSLVFRFVLKCLVPVGCVDTSADHKPSNFTRARTDLHEFGIPQQSTSGVVIHITIAT